MRTGRNTWSLHVLELWNILEHSFVLCIYITNCYCMSQSVHTIVFVELLLFSDSSHVLCQLHDLTLLTPFSPTSHVCHVTISTCEVVGIFAHNSNYTQAYTTLCKHGDIILWRTLNTLHKLYTASNFQGSTDELLHSMFMSIVILNLHDFLSAYNTSPTLDLTYMFDHFLPFSVKFCCTLLSPTILCVHGTVLFHTFLCLKIFLCTYHHLPQ